MLMRRHRLSLKASLSLSIMVSQPNPPSTEHQSEDEPGYMEVAAPSAPENVTQFINKADQLNGLHPTKDSRIPECTIREFGDTEERVILMWRHRLLLKMFLSLLMCL